MPLGRPSYICTGTGTKRKQVLSQDKYYYVPILESLKALLQNEHVIHEISVDRTSKDGVLRDFCDGKMCLDHPLFGTESNALQIIAYYDDLEICNPLGAAAKRHKIGAFFFFLANIRPCLRSSLKYSQLFAIAKTSDIKSYGIDSVLQPFVSDLQTLANEGISVSVKVKSYNFKGCLLAFLADNLASHALGGFKESMGFAFRFCRKCLATKEQSQKAFISSMFEHRTPQEHIKQCALLVGPLKDHYSTTYGINRNSILNRIPNFSVVSGLSHDIMHDLFEGVIPFELKLLLKHCIELKYFSLNELNEKICAFDFGYSNVSNKPGVIDSSVLSSSGKFRLTASSMWLLSRTLPLIVGLSVPASDPYWQCYCLLLKIVDICTSLECSKDSIAFLSTLIEEHHSIFVNLHGEVLTPKMHSMVHYPDQILNFGPIIFSWCMRMEAKLKLCKRVGRFGNFKNICYSVAHSHQRWMCLQLQDSSFIKIIPEIGGNATVQAYAEEPPHIQDAVQNLGIRLQESRRVCHPPWVKLQSSVFKKTAIVIVKLNDGVPVFGKVADILVFNSDSSNICLVVHLFITEYYDNHFHAFCVKPTQELQIIQLSSLKYPFILHVHSFSSASVNKFIVLKYGLGV